MSVSMAGTSKSEEVVVVLSSLELEVDEDEDDEEDDVLLDVEELEEPEEVEVLPPPAPDGAAVDPDDPPLPPPQAVTRAIVENSSKSLNCTIILSILLNFMEKKGERANPFPLSSYWFSNDIENHFRYQSTNLYQTSTSAESKPYAS